MPIVRSKKIWDGSAVQHRALFVWVHVWGSGNGLVLQNEMAGAIGNRPHSWKLTKDQLASFCKCMNWKALHV